MKLFVLSASGDGIIVEATGVILDDAGRLTGEAAAVVTIDPSGTIEADARYAQAVDSALVIEVPEWDVVERREIPYGHATQYLVGLTPDEAQDFMRQNPDPAALGGTDALLN